MRHRLRSPQSAARTPGVFARARVGEGPAGRTWSAWVEGIIGPLRIEVAAPECGPVNTAFTDLFVENGVMSGYTSAIPQANPLSTADPGSPRHDLACGGFEHNEQMRIKIASRHPSPPVDRGRQHNTIDGILAASSAQHGSDG